MTLTDFLLGRVAEDEAATYVVVPDPRNPGYFGHECLICPDGPSFGGTRDAIAEIAEEHAEGIHRRSRVLAECEAKRRIVEQWDACQPPASGADYAVEQELELVLMHLALPYADHPDFCEEWRP